MKRVFIALIVPVIGMVIVLAGGLIFGGCTWPDSSPAPATTSTPAPVLESAPEPASFVEEAIPDISLEPVDIQAEPVPEGAAVSFSDENLAEVIRDALGKSQCEEITAAELAGLTILNAEECGISDLSAMEYCTGLTVLNLWNNRIIDISPLENLTGLTILSLWNNRITDISPLENLSGLAALYLGKNRISDISSLENLTGLTGLSLWDNQISDISPLENLTALVGLSLWSNQISDISSLENLASLMFLDLRNNQIMDISPLVENIGLGPGDVVWLEGNNLDLTQGSEDLKNIKALEDRGVIVGLLLPPQSRNHIRHCGLVK